ncbi:hypothetical protein KY290_021705 [Solanum tuberosum]|uniref:NB-ARC domain-containing protein n=1 Tax=Solanum tuberosum TaxID=4113 RepID=A0ABQ7V4D5_SOLTU|nr:hypothetical protein KY289_020868 [Solanum tuberosum]KAH0758212.1 hypothetical protein KY290_021705 [Solanum tuberosum]
MGVEGWLFSLEKGNKQMGFWVAVFAQLLVVLDRRRNGKWSSLAGCGGGTMVRPWRLKKGQNWVSTTRIFNESVITSHFDVLAKITVFQEYHVRNLYLGLFHYTSSSNEGLEENNDEALVNLLQKSLECRRYLVIVDDIWTTEAWDEISMCFPLHNNGSRILLTTRNTKFAEYYSLGTPPIQMRLLTFDECWNLLYQKLFKNECLSPEFKKIGKEIARICQGLPLATVVMVGVLLKIGNSLDEWKKVVEDVNVLMSKDLDHHCSKVLTLSYYHLPCHIIACLLYLVRCLQEE